MDDEKKTAPILDSEPSTDRAVGVTEDGQLVNASGHVQELDRSFGFWSVASIGVLSDNAWGAGGGALVVA
jgi:choline transport protein